MELFARSCGLCRHRPRKDDGFGSCPVTELSFSRYLAVPDSVDNGCVNFRLGDKKGPNKTHVARDLAKLTEPLF